MRQASHLLDEKLRTLVSRKATSRQQEQQMHPSLGQSSAARSDYPSDTVYGMIVLGHHSVRQIEYSLAEQAHVCLDANANTWTLNCWIVGGLRGVDIFSRSMRSTQHPAPRQYSLLTIIPQDYYKGLRARG